jgi:hypothetical protein
MQVVELHFSRAPVCDYAAIKAHAEAILGDALDLVELSNDQPTLFSHRNHPVQYTGGAIPAQTAILAAHTPIDIERYAGEIQQSWGFPACEEALIPSGHTLVVTEMMASELPPRERCKLFHGVLQSVIEHTRPDVLVFKHSQQVVDPKTYLAAVDVDPILRPGSVNVRFFNISNSDGDMLMDTRGLQEIGLHDFQCHFRKLDPNQVSRVLFNAAFYMFENGLVIESGNTIAGITSDSKWTCQFEDSLLDPGRTVIDLNPGDLYAAGKRH